MDGQTEAVAAARRILHALVHGLPGTAQCLTYLRGHKEPPAIRLGAAVVVSDTAEFLPPDILETIKIPDDGGPRGGMTVAIFSKGGGE